MVRSRHRVDVEVYSNTCSSQVDYHLLFVLCRHLTHLQVDAKIEVAGENETEQDSKEAETEVPKFPSASLLPTPVSQLVGDTFRFSLVSVSDSLQSVCRPWDVMYFLKEVFKRT